MRRAILAITLAFLMATVSFSSIGTADDTSGRQIDDVDCSGYSFEDLFEYDNAIFEFEVLDDWATSKLSANSWVNESKAATVRANIDSLFDGVPGGNNSWISTDEREAVREIGPKCIADMYTRIGIREGMSHRGGVDWNDVEFVEDGIALDEVDLIPADHPEERNCQNVLASSDCREVPVSATNNLEISMFTKAGETHNARFNQLANQGASNFTIGLNATNMTSADMNLHFPIVEGLRMAAYDIHDVTDGVAVSNLDAGSVEMVNLPDGSVVLSINIGYNLGDWPMIRNVFVDMTTMPPETNDIPVWTTEVPVDDTIIPMLTENTENLAVEGSVLENWASDNDGWSLDCLFNEDGWSSRMDSDGNLLVTSGSTESGTAVCSLKDPYNATNEVTRTWRFGQPASFSATPGIYSDSVDIEITPSLLVQNLAIDLVAMDSSLNTGPSSGASLGSNSATVTVSLSQISPGEVLIHVMASSDDMLDWVQLLDLNIEKSNSPPILLIDSLIGEKYATWSADQYSFSLSGTAMDPDSSGVELSATMCGDTTTGFTQESSSWDVTLSIANCVAQGVTQYDVVITATDSEGATTSLEINVASPFEQNDDSDNAIIKVQEESGLPSLGMFATVICMLGAALLVRKD